jgi:hypothetical protein
MGGGKWDTHAYRSAAKTRSDTGKPDFGYSTDVKAGRASGIHETLDPTKMNNGVRESRDSDEHPESLPIAVFFDVTGSMHRIPQVLQTKLAKLMDVVIDKAQIQHPQILVGAVGDATCDRYPFQVSQFESDNRLDEQLRNLILEGGGGGQVMESYALPYRFAAYHTDLDSFNKRGKKGYLITMGDEMPWPNLPAHQVSHIFDTGVEEDETVEDLLAKAQEKYEVYHLQCLDGSYSDRDDIRDRWQELLGERYVKVEDSNLICEVIAGLIHGMETASDLDKVVADLGLSGSDGDKVKNALVPVMAGSSTVSKVAEGDLPGAHEDDSEDVSPV